MGRTPAVPVDLAVFLPQLEADILLTMRILTNASSNMEKPFCASDLCLAELRDNIGRHSSAVAAVQESGLALTEAAGRVERAARNTLLDAAAAIQFADDASDLAKACALQHMATSENVPAPGRWLGDLETVARQSGLLALNASLAAAQGQSSPMSLDSLALESRGLADRLGLVTKSLSQHLHSVETRATHNQIAFDKLQKLLGAVTTSLTDLQAGADRQRIACEALDGLVQVHVAQTRPLQGGVSVLAAAATQALDLTRAARRCADATAQLLQRLTRRSVVFLRNASHGDRRGGLRVPVKVPGVLECGSQRFYVLTIELSRGGCVLVRADGSIMPEYLVGSLARLQLEALGAVTIRILATSELGIHTRFEGLSSPACARVDCLLAGILREHEPVIAFGQSVAAQISHAFNQCVASGEIAFDDLMSSNYQPVADTDPVQYECAGLRLYENVLPPVLEAARRSVLAPLFVVATDLNAYTPVHHAEFSKSQVAGKPVWNDLNARNKRLHDRWLTLIGARNRAHYSLHAYARHGKDGTPQAIEVLAAPIYVQGQLWGNVQVGREY